MAAVAAVAVIASADGFGELSASAAVKTVHASHGQIFRGNGGLTLPPFTVAAPSTLFWSNSGDIFQIFPSGASIHGSVNAQSRKGWTYLPKGRYTLQINAIGSWALNIVRGIVAPGHFAGGWIGYSGNGGMELPPFRVRRSQKLFWQASGDIFQIFSAGFTGVSVNSQAHRGSTYVTAGIQQLQINTTGGWRILWRP